MTLKLVTAHLKDKAMLLATVTHLLSSAAGLFPISHRVREFLPEHESMLVLDFG